VIDAVLPSALPETPYSRFGDLILLLGILLGLTPVLASWLKSRGHPGHAPPQQA
jgi:hypothetical protein